MTFASDITAKLIKALQIFFRLLKEALGVILGNALNSFNEDFVYNLLCLFLGFFNIATERMVNKEA